MSAVTLLDCQDNGLLPVAAGARIGAGWDREPKLMRRLRWARR
jgi:hypothetical protein